MEEEVEAERTEGGGRVAGEPGMSLEGRTKGGVPAEGETEMSVEGWTADGTGWR